MREIVLDTETTGLEPAEGHRIVEIGCLELVNHVATGRDWQVYINPERVMPAGAFAVHGLSTEFLSDKLVFAEVVGDFLDFVGDDKLVIHNAAFDLGFLNAELKKLGFAPLDAGRAVDTVRLARQRFPGAQASLDALCRRFGIDNSHRTRHGALLDAELLAEVYLELVGGRQPGLGLGALGDGEDASGDEPVAAETRPRREPRPHAPSAEEAAAHTAFVAALDDPIWEQKDEPAD
jgi:DNA polymerase III subunit epsilon